MRKTNIQSMKLTSLEINALMTRSEWVLILNWKSKQFNVKVLTAGLIYTVLSDFMDALSPFRTIYAEGSQREGQDEVKQLCIAYNTCDLKGLRQTGIVQQL